MTTNSRKSEVLVMCPPPEQSGGVANYYSLVNRHFRSDAVNLHFFYTGSRSVASGGGRALQPLVDLIALRRTLPRHDLVVLNPSLDPKSLIRDGVYHLAARLTGMKTIVFFRGWSPRWEGIIDRYARGLFRRVFAADRLVVLCSRFGDCLAGWGFPPRAIVRETTTYEHHECEAANDPRRIIFLSRFARGKGCLTAIQAVERLLPRFPDVHLYMVGDGELRQELVDYVQSRGLAAQVEFTGWLSGEPKYRLLARCGIMLFPTDYGEGMPNALVEGMGMGIPIVSRPVAGIADIIADGENGFLIPSLDPADFADRVARLLEDPELWREMSQRNRRVGRERFSITSVVARLESLYLDLLRQERGCL
ncbi:glycosyltransferase family 4 protein [Geomonas azotofigens]|uniref:glycosyltransferase family 4 protein n=1 Tax=Geomonas azotofigens TaxID=2843196 RepID=UPI001C122FC2|nr:glycosyltransferase family 4 protein [Geomonas azotofigens]MBU5614629.1 glycosyltransferase family 4 protein [Geomonas azotofigens]